MQIVVKTDLFSQKEDIINVFYGENKTYTDKWVNDYFDEQICLLKGKESKECDEYFVEIDDSGFYLVKKFQKLSKGYLYNSSEKKCTKLQSIRIMGFDGEIKAIDDNNDTLWNGINSEIVHRIMRQVDHDSLYQINLKIEQAIKTKVNWTSTELIMLQNEVTKKYKKELYSSILKKMKRFEKKTKPKQNKFPNVVLGCKTILINEDGKLTGCGSLPDISNHSGQSCSLEYQIVSNEK